MALALTRRLVLIQGADHASRSIKFSFCPSRINEAVPGVVRDSGISASSENLAGLRSILVIGGRLRGGKRGSCLEYNRRRPGGQDRGTKQEVSNLRDPS